MAEALGHGMLYRCNHKLGIPDSVRDVAGATRIMMTKVADCVTGPPYYTAATRKLGRPQHPSPGAGLVLSYPLKSKAGTMICKGIETNTYP